MILALTELQAGQVLASLRLWQFVHHHVGTMANAPPEILALAKDGAHARMSLSEIDDLFAQIGEQTARQAATPLEPALRTVAAWVQALPLTGDEA